MKGAALLSTLVSGALAWGIFLPIRAVAQISSDGTTNTTVNSNGSDFTILNGIKKGSNLFHSFRDFSVPRGGSANFDLNNTPNISNIFSRVTGGDISDIDGLIQTTNGNNSANLFLINPAGIIFGENARLNVGGSFLGTTANSIKFADGVEFSAIDANTAPLLTVDVPVGLQYGVNPAPIKVQNSKIGIAIGGNLSLYGGDLVINNGKLTAPQGTLKLASISQPAPVSFNSNYDNINDFAGITIDADSNLSGANIHLQGNNLKLSGQLISENNLNLIATDTVTIRDTPTDPFIATAGGELVVQGNQNLDIFVLNHPNSGLFAGRDLILRSSNPVIGDAHYYSGGNFRIEQLDGSLGDFLSEKDPIIRSQGDVSFNNYRGASLHIIAGGQVSFNATIITGADTTNNTINPVNTPELSNVKLSDGTELEIDGSARPTLDVRAGVDQSVIGTPATALGGLFLDANFTPELPPSVNNSATGSGISVGDVLMQVPDGLVLLTNQYNPNPNLTAGDITIRADGGVSGGIITGGIPGNGGDIILDSRGGINIAGSVSASALSTGDFFVGPHAGNGGDIKFLADRDFQLSPGSLIASFGLLGGNIELNTPDNITQTAGLIASVSSASNSTTDGLLGGNINIKANNLSLTQGATLGIATSGVANSGDVNVDLTGSIENNKSIITNQIFSGAEGNGGNININAQNARLNNGAQILGSTGGKGDAGNINLTVADTLNIDGHGTLSSSQISSQVGILDGDGNAIISQGNAGDLTITAQNVQITNGGLISGSTGGEGDGGNINLNVTDTLKIDGEGTLATSGIVSQVGGIDGNGNAISGKGNGGDLTITAQNVELTNGGGISGSTAGEGDGGNIHLTVADTLKIDGQSTLGFSSGINSQVGSLDLSGNLLSGKGNGGDITITVQDVEITNGGAISGSTAGEGDGGNIHLTVADTLKIDGQSTLGISSGIGSPVGFLDLNGNLVSGKGNGGDVTITAQDVEITNGGAISGSTAGEGNAGNLTLTVADTLKIDGQGTVTPSEISSAVGFLDGNGNLVGGQGNGGDLTITAQDVQLTNAGRISGSTSGEGDAGTINLQISDSLHLNNQSTITSSSDANAFGVGGNIFIQTPLLELTNSQIAAASESQFAAGSVQLDTQQLNLSDGATISVSGSGAGGAGDLIVNADEINLNNQASLQAQVAAGSQGNIQLDTQLLQLRRNGNITTNATNTANGGNITINSPLIVGLENSDIVANAIEGNGGNINLTTQGIFGLQFRDRLTSKNDITASSEFGLNGTVDINNFGIDPSAGFVELPTELVDPSQRIARNCLKTFGNSFVVTGRGGIPQNPTEQVNVSRTWSDIRDLSKYRQSTSKITTNKNQESNKVPVVEASRLIGNSKGEIELVANDSPSLKPQQLNCFS